MAGTNNASLGIGGGVLGTCGGAASVSGVCGSHSSSWGCQMDNLVSDLSLALDESQQLQRRRRPFRRRANQQQALGRGCGGSDFSSSSAEDAQQGTNSQDNKSSIPLTDSDEGFSPCPRPPRYRSTRPLRPPRPPPGSGVVESDSVTESFSPAPRPANIRRKPKCKRLALDPAGELSPPCPRGQRWRAAPVLHRMHALHTAHTRRSNLCGGKRKRSRDGGSEGGGEEYTISHCTTMDTGSSCLRLELSPSFRAKASGATGGGDECSSDDSDGGALAGDGGDVLGVDVFTCDEGREADDEQSDWVTEGPGPVYGVPSVAQAMPCEEGGVCSGQHSSRLRFQKIRERLMRREIRAGRRRLRERRPGHVIIGGTPSVCESLTRFLQDPLASELQLRPSSLAECDQLQRLAQLYSLHLRVGGEEGPATTTTTSCFITKTSLTTSGQDPLPSGGCLLFSPSYRPPVEVPQPFCVSSPLTPVVVSQHEDGDAAAAFPWGFPTPLSDATKKRRKTPSSTSLYGNFSATHGAGSEGAVERRHNVGKYSSPSAGGTLMSPSLTPPFTPSFRESDVPTVVSPCRDGVGTAFCETEVEMVG